MADIKGIKTTELSFWITGTSSLIQHKWSAKAEAMIRDKGQKKGVTKNRDARNPEQESLDATHFTEDGEYGIPILAFKAAMISAAHKDIGLEKTVVRKSVFVVCKDEKMIVPMECSDPIIREDHVRIGAGSADLRYRPEFRNWKAQVTLVFDNAMLSAKDILNLANRAGFGVGIGDWRPEKGGEFGRFEVDLDRDVVERVATNG